MFLYENTLQANPFGKRSYNYTKASNAPIFPIILFRSQIVIRDSARVGLFVSLARLQPLMADTSKDCNAMDEGRA